MISDTQLQGITGTTVYDVDGDKIGKAGQVYVDDQTGSPEWLTVNTGLFGSNESFVPLRDAQVMDGGEVRVPYGKQQVKDAPRLADDGHLSPQEEDELYRYYGIASTGGVVDDTTSGYADTGVAAGTTGTVGHDTSGPTTDSAMTRSEEHLEVGTERREAGRARLRKYVTTEQETVTVPVRHEEVRLETEPITEANRGEAMSGPAISEEEHEVVLHEERPVVTTEAVPVERVRVATEEVEATETVSGEVRKERVDLDAGTEARTDR